MVQDADGWTNVREAADLKSPVVTRVDAGDRVIISSEKSEFYDCLLLFQEGELPEVFGFIHKSRVKITGTALGAGIVHDPDGWSYLREGPSTQDRALGKIFPEDGFFIVLSQAGEWYKIETRQGKRGFLHLSRLEWVMPRN